MARRFPSRTTITTVSLKTKPHHVQGSLVYQRRPTWQLISQPGSLLANLIEGPDGFIQKSLPALRNYSYYQVVEVAKSC